MNHVLHANAALDVEQFDAYVEQYHDLFARSDQRQCFGLYLYGLITAPARRNVESIAGACAARITTDSNLAQALHHFVTQSPWDHNRILARYRELLPTTHRDGSGVWVVHDGVLLKKGRNSVGAQRQYARSLGRKVNCQVAVVVGIASPAGFVPLTARLYLPGYWLREYPELVAKIVPPEHRVATSKAALALGLLDELRAEGWKPATAAPAEGYAVADGFAAALGERGIRLLPETGAVATASERFEWLKNRLGLDHFEGRTWAGWHHHMALVFAAAGFLFATESRQPPRPSNNGVDR